MEESYSVCSPRRILSVSKKRREATVSFADPDCRASGFHGPKPAEVYGFVGSITTVVATVILLVWAYVPESWLHWIGIFYYPSRYWALAVPAYAMMTVVLALVFYCGLNFMSTPPPSSLYTIYVDYLKKEGKKEFTISNRKRVRRLISNTFSARSTARQRKEHDQLYKESNKHYQQYNERSIYYQHLVL